jgi:hypothetical protein
LTAMLLPLSLDEQCPCRSGRDSSYEAQFYHPDEKKSVSIGLFYFKQQEEALLCEEEAARALDRVAYKFYEEKGWEPERFVTKACTCMPVQSRLRYSQVQNSHHSVLQQSQSYQVQLAFQPQCHQWQAHMQFPVEDYQGEHDAARRAAVGFKEYVNELRSARSKKPNTGLKGVNERGRKYEARNTPFPVRSCPCMRAYAQLGGSRGGASCLPD